MPGAANGPGGQGATEPGGRGAKGRSAGVPGRRGAAGPGRGPGLDRRSRGAKGAGKEITF